MMVDLIDVSRDDHEISIHQWLIDQKLAERGETICKRSNPTHDHYQICTYKNDSSNISSLTASTSGCVTASSTKQSGTSSASKPSTLNYMSTAEKLEALRKYKARYSRSSNVSDQ